MRPLSRRSLVAGVLASALAPGIPPAVAAEAEPRALLSAAGFDDDARRNVARGRIVAEERATYAETELSGAVAMWVPARPDEVAKRLREGLVVQADREVSAWCAIVPGNETAAWSGIAYQPDERDEIERFLDARPGETFNLSIGELSMLRGRLAGRSATDVETAGVLSAVYRQILVGRYVAYLTGGATGLAAYARADGFSSPADDLRRIEMSKHLPAALRRSVDELDHFPAPLPPGDVGRFFWKKTIVDDRPIFVLSHVVVGDTEDGVRFGLREYYPGHSYNILQQSGLAAPMDGGSLMMAVNSTVTDRVKGLFGPLARPIGRHRALDALEDYFARMRDVLAGPDMADAPRPLPRATAAVHEGG